MDAGRLGARRSCSGGRPVAAVSSIRVSVGFLEEAEPTAGVQQQGLAGEAAAGQCRALTVPLQQPNWRHGGGRQEVLLLLCL